MSWTQNWELLPDVNWGVRENWYSLGDNRYAAVRVRLLIAQSSGQQSQFGPVLEAYNVGPEDILEFRKRRERVVNQTTTVSEAIKSATMSRVCDQLVTKISVELSSKAPGFSGKLGSEILSKSECEITSTTEKALVITNSRSTQVTEEDEYSITLKGGNGPRVAEIRRRYWPRRWDVYLHSYEYIELSYKTWWLWGDIRRTIKQAESGLLGWPLVTANFFEPQSAAEVCYGPITNELADPNSVKFQKLTGSTPEWRAPWAETLENLARSAFPVTKEERAAARRSAGKKSATRRFAGKKSAAKKITRKAARKMLARHTSVKKLVAKKAVLKKTSARKTSARKASARTSAAVGPAASG